jgi:hypothetical protein
MRWELQCRVCIGLGLLHEKRGAAEKTNFLALCPCKVFFDLYVSALESRTKGTKLMYKIHLSLYTTQTLERRTGLSCSHQFVHFQRRLKTFFYQKKQEWSLYWIVGTSTRMPLSYRLVYMTACSCEVFSSMVHTGNRRTRGLRIHI